MITRQQIIKVLKTIPDPELNISVWDLGLIYAVKTDSKNNVNIRMTLTTIGCPLFSLISDPIKEKISRIKGVKSVTLDLTFEPPWTVDRISARAKAQLGYI